VVVPPDCLGRCDSILHDVKGRLRAAYGIDHTTLQIESAAYAHVDDIHSH
jgi:cobalt-zinc-cadmium efflux system protein